jgi:lactoylglutathione lyase
MKFGYTIIYVENVVKTVEFYERCFGLERRFITQEEDYGEINTGETTLSFSLYALISTMIPEFYPNSPQKIPAGVEITLITDDVESAYQKALDNGATPYLSPVSKPWGQVVAYVRDLNGFLVCLGTHIE